MKKISKLYGLVGRGNFLKMSPGFTDKWLNTSHLFVRTYHSSSIRMSEKARKIEEVIQSDVNEEHGDDQIRTPLDKRVYKILAIDGGGIRGIIPARILLEIERRTGKKIPDLFDMVAGTSTGGILALGLTAPKEEKDGKFSTKEPEDNSESLLNLYLNSRTVIFKKNVTGPLTAIDMVFSALNFVIGHSFGTYEIVVAAQGLFLGTQRTRTWQLGGALFAISGMLCGSIISPFYYHNLITWFLPTYLFGILGHTIFTHFFEHKYYRDGLEHLIHNRYGERKLSNALTDLVLTSYDVDKSRAKNFIGHKGQTSRKDDFSIFDVALATSAAPSFFNPKKIRSRYYIDGGVVANSPGLNAAIEALKEKRADELFVLSIGTGEKRGAALLGNFINKGLLYWAKNYPSFSIKAQMELVNSQLEELLTNERYIRLQVELQKLVNLDATSPRNVKFLYDSVEKFIMENSQEIDHLCFLLTGEKAKTQFQQTTFKDHFQDAGPDFSTHYLSGFGYTIPYIVLFIILTGWSYNSTHEHREGKKIVQKNIQNGDYAAAMSALEKLAVSSAKRSSGQLNAKIRKGIYDSVFGTVIFKPEVLPHVLKDSAAIKVIITEMLTNGSVDLDFIAGVSVCFANNLIKQERYEDARKVLTIDSALSQHDLIIAKKRTLPRLEKESESNMLEDPDNSTTLSR